MATSPSCRRQGPQPGRHPLPAPPAVAARLRRLRVTVPAWLTGRPGPLPGATAPTDRRCLPGVVAAPTPLLRILPIGLLLLPSLPVRAEGQVQLSCPGTLLEARGQAELQRPTTRLQVSIGLEAQGSNADQALEQLQRRLAAVRTALQTLEVAELRVSSPSTWPRPAEAGRPALLQASLQVNGILAPARLQSLIRVVGALPGVQLAPVSTLADPAEDARVRQQLLQRAWQDALRQVRPLAELIERPRLTPLEVRLEGQELSPYPLRAMAADAVAPFRPEELSRPRDRLALQVRFCAQ